MVLAAGRGERLWPLTETRPKHLLPVVGVSIIERTMRALVRGGISEIVLVVNFKADMIKSTLGDGRDLGCRIEYVHQKKLEGTADAIRTSRQRVEGEDRFLTIYGDDYYGADAIGRFLKTGKQWSDIMIGSSQVEDSSRFGSLEVRKGIVSSINEKAERGRGRVNAGLYLFGEEVFSAVEKTTRSPRGEYELTDSLRLLIRQGKRIRAFLLGKSEWLGLSYPWDLLEANKLALEKQVVSVKGKMEGGVQIKGPASIGAGCTVKAGSYLEGPVFIDEGTVIGPNSYLRPFTCLGKNAKVGAGCEVKNSILMDDVKIPHLSYVGDSIIGKGSSLGAGTVTANLRFDHATVRSKVKGAWVDSRRRKLGAILGDNVRTGINVSLFPGVKVGPEAWLGPGAVVENDVPGGRRVKAS